MTSTPRVRQSVSRKRGPFVVIRFAMRYALLRTTGAGMSSVIGNRHRSSGDVNPGLFRSHVHCPFFAAIVTAFFLICWLGAPGLALADDGLSFERLAPLDPEEALKSFRILDGFRLELVAAEPLVTDPVDIAYDPDGRMFVVEMRDYPYPTPEGQTPLGRVRILEDRDGDGRYDSSHVFADRLGWPTSVALYRGGAFVVAAPDIWYFKDTDGDLRADVRQKVFTGFGNRNVQAIVNNLKWGVDHWIYGATSGNGGMVRPADDPTAPAVSLARRDFRFDPFTRRFEALSGGARFGNSFDDWYRRFICNIRNPGRHVVLPDRYLARNRQLLVREVVQDVVEAGDQVRVFRISPVEPWREVRARRWADERRPYPRSELVGAGFVTSSSGVTIYRGAAYPERYRGNLFVGEVAGNLVLRQVLEPDGVSFRGHRAQKDVEFLASTDTWFRPVNFVNAPDGTLHIVDMYRETIEHPWSIPDDIKAQLDLESGRDRGRIYRLVPADFQQPPQPALSQASNQQLVEYLANANSWWRETASRLLVERQAVDAATLLVQMARSHPFPLARLHALWVLQRLGQLNDELLAHALRDESPGVREHAVRLSESRLSASKSLASHVAALASDPVPRVRMQVAFTAGFLPDGQRTKVLVTIARRDAADRWIRTAILSSIPSGSTHVFETLLTDAPYMAQPDRATLLESLAELAAAYDASSAVRVLEATAKRLPHPDSDSPNIANTNIEDVEDAIVAGVGRGHGRSGGSPEALFARLSAPARQLLSRVFGRAAHLATAAERPEDERIAAVERLAFAPLRQSRRELSACLDPHQPPSVQIAAARALAAHANPEVVEILLKHWPAATPSVRGEMLEAMLRRTDRINRLLSEVEKGTIAVADIPSRYRQVLQKHRNAEIRQRATRLLATASNRSREEIIARYLQQLSQQADASAGHEVFRKQCATCHRLNGEGHHVGPNLSTIQQRTPEELLVHILDPNREVSPNYTNYVITLDDGRIVTGLIETETAASLTLKRAEGVRDTIQRDQIDVIASSGASLMPEGLEQKISPREMADLIAYLLATPR